MQQDQTAADAAERTQSEGPDAEVLDGQGKHAPDKREPQLHRLIAIRKKSVAY